VKRPGLMVRLQHYYDPFTGRYLQTSTEAPGAFVSMIYNNCGGSGGMGSGGPYNPFGNQSPGPFNPDPGTGNPWGQDFGDWLDGQDGGGVFTGPCVFPTPMLPPPFPGDPGGGGHGGGDDPLPPPSCEARFQEFYENNAVFIHRDCDLNSDDTKEVCEFICSGLVDVCTTWMTGCYGFGNGDPDQSGIGCGQLDDNCKNLPPWLPPVIAVPNRLGWPASERVSLPSYY
jgi:hypothetical protein